MKNVTIRSQELEQLRTRVKDFVDTTKLYAQVQDAIIFQTLNELTSNVSGRNRAWDYFDDGLKAETKNATRVESLIDYEETPQVLDNMEEDSKSGLELGNDLTHESDEPRGADATVVQVIEDFPSVPVTPLSNQIIKNFEVTPVQYEEEPITVGNNDNKIVDKDTLEKSDILEKEKSNIDTEEKEEKEKVEEKVEEDEEEEEEIDPAFRFVQ